MDTDSDASGDDVFVDNQSSRTDQFVFMARADGTPIEQNVDDLDNMMNDG